MNILQIAILAFIIMECGNIVVLYFYPEFKLGNGVGVFNEWDKTKENENSHLLAKYMTNWVGNVKLIFILLLLAVLLVGDEKMQLITTIAMILSISAFYFKLRPIMVKLDERGEISPKGYSKILTAMITGMMIMFSVALIVHLVIT